MKKIELFDPAMCCSTGVCGPSIDAELLRVATVVNSLQKNGAEIERHNPASDPKAFADNQLISSMLAKGGAGILPITLLDGKAVKSGEYPTNEEFSFWTGTEILCTDGQGASCCCPDDCC